MASLFQWSIIQDMGTMLDDTINMEMGPLHCSLGVVHPGADAGDATPTNHNTKQGKVVPPCFPPPSSVLEPDDAGYAPCHERPICVADSLPFEWRDVVRRRIAAGAPAAASQASLLPTADDYANLLKILSRSTSLFPKTSSCPRGTMATDINDSVAGLSGENNFRDQRKALDHEGNSTENNPARPNSSDRPQPNNVNNTNSANNKLKKSIRFCADVTVYGLNPSMSSEEKENIWYGADDFDRFKRDAAEDAGVMIVRRFGAKVAEKSHHFVMAGDFDGQFSAADSTNNSNTARRAYYNENEHSNSQNRCRRGLGYHFSRSRRRSRAVARSAVAAWQRSLLANPGDRPDPRTPQKLPTLGKDGTSGGNLDKAERTRLTLALVSARCSWTAREEARWRGDVDYRAAHPERHANVDAKAPSAKPLAKPLARTESYNGGLAESAAGKRDRARDIAAVCDGAGRKRRRTAGGCREKSAGGALPHARRICRRLRAEA